MPRFQNGHALPAQYGRGLDERCVEYPWFLSRLPGGPGRLLDAGSTLNHELLLDQPSLTDKRITILTLSPEEECHWRKGVAYAFDEMRSLPFRDGLFDFAVAISSIEHVGCDYSFYTGVRVSSDPCPDDFSVAVRELARVADRARPCCRDCEYVAWVSELMRTGRWPESPHVDADHAAAARAVACVRMQKR